VFQASLVLTAAEIVFLYFLVGFTKHSYFVRLVHSAACFFLRLTSVSPPFFHLLFGRFINVLVWNVTATYCDCVGLVLVGLCVWRIKDGTSSVSDGRFPIQKSLPENPSPPTWWWFCWVVIFGVLFFDCNIIYTLCRIYQSNWNLFVVTNQPTNKPLPHP